MTFENPTGSPANNVSPPCDGDDEAWPNNCLPWKKKQISAPARTSSHSPAAMAGAAAVAQGFPSTTSCHPDCDDQLTAAPAADMPKAWLVVCGGTTTARRPPLPSPDAPVHVTLPGTEPTRVSALASTVHVPEVAFQLSCQSGLRNSS